MLPESREGCVGTVGSVAVVSNSVGGRAAQPRWRIALLLAGMLVLAACGASDSGGEWSNDDAAP